MINSKQPIEILISNRMNSNSKGVIQDRGLIYWKCHHMYINKRIVSGIPVLQCKLSSICKLNLTIYKLMLKKNKKKSVYDFTFHLNHWEL